MVEVNKGPKERKITSAHLAEMFGSDYRECIERKAAGFGIREKLVFFDSPKSHNGGSQALYIVEQYVGDDLILVSVLEPNKETSKHRHEAPMVQETYFHIDGESFVEVGEKKLVLNRNQGMIEVPLDISHQVRTQENPSLTLIIMKNARLVSPDRLHIQDV